MSHYKTYLNTDLVWITMLILVAEVDVFSIFPVMDSQINNTILDCKIQRVLFNEVLTQ